MGAVHGYVVALDTGAPVANATVFIVSGVGPIPEIAAVTGSEGEFGFGGLAPGTWVLRAVDSDGRTGDAQVEVIADATVDVAIVL